MKRFFKVLLLYIKKVYKNILALFFSEVAFAVVFYLSDFPFYEVTYAFMLCLLGFILIYSLGFFKFYKKYTALQALYDNMIKYKDDSNVCYIEQNLPSPDKNSAEEQIYQKIIECLCRKYSQSVTKASQIQTENCDYYMTWVHQIKSPISVMSMILQNEDTPQNRQLSNELFKVEQYVEMALNFARLDSPSNDFVIKKYNVDKIIRKAVSKYSSQFVSKHIKLEFTPTHIEVFTDEKWLGFMIEQILSNAVKYTNAGLVKIYSKGNVLSIADTGIGISEEDLPRIFEKGFTGFNGRLNRKSTGLGLYLCKKTSEKLELPIYVKSSAGVGTTIFIDLNQRELEIE